MKAYRVAGFTDEITTCELCGKPELKGTVQMIALDADGNDDTDHYFGSSCAAKAAGWTQKKVKDDVRSVAFQKAAARRAEEDRLFGLWLMENYQTSDVVAAVKLSGIRSNHLFIMFHRDFKARV